MTAFGAEQKPPLGKFFIRAEEMATSAFLTIPYVGTEIADFFNRVVVPFCAPKRDRIMTAIFRSSKSLEGGLQVLLMRLIPLPSDAARDPSRGSR
jgi:hypothetical protein